VATAWASSTAGSCQLAHGLGSSAYGQYLADLASEESLG
jgi:hypothetical protein